MHMAWVSHVCGRIKSDYRYTNQIVYNNFPWPVLDGGAASALTSKSQKTIETTAQTVLDIRASEADATLADLYSPITMPEALFKAHRALDAAVDAAYALGGGKKTWKSDAERVAYLFTLYKKLTSL